MDYMEAQLQKYAALRDISGPDMIGMLSGNGGTQVDLVLYVFNQSKYQYQTLRLPLTCPRSESGRYRVSQGIIEVYEHCATHS